MRDPEATQLVILHRDDRLIAVAKPSGMVVHRGWGLDPITVADILRDSIIGRPVHAVHRLDRGTSGVLLFALDSEAARLMQAEFQSGRAIKRYLALVRGPMKEGCLLDHPVPSERGGPRVPAVTNFEPLNHKDRWSLVEAVPRTGRMHQIRRHLKHLSHPIVGDVRYGKGEINRFFREHYHLERMALHAFELSLRGLDDQPIKICAPLPADLSDPLGRLGIWPLPEGYLPAN